MDGVDTLCGDDREQREGEHGEGEEMEIERQQHQQQQQGGEGGMSSSNVLDQVRPSNPILTRALTMLCPSLS